MIMIMYDILRTNVDIDCIVTVSVNIFRDKHTIMTMTMNDNKIILFGHRKNSKILNIVDICIMLIMLVTDILVCPGYLIVAL